MNGFNTGAIVIVVLLVFNSASQLRRARAAPHDAGHALRIRGRRLDCVEVGLYLLMVLSWVVGLALPVVSPESPSGQFMAQAWSMPSLVAWSMFCVLGVQAARGVLRAVSMRQA